MMALLLSLNERFYRLFIIVITFLFLVACAQSPPVRVEDRSQPPSRKITQHVVERGDTLFAIAWRYGLDLKRFSNANKLSKRSILYPGQILVLKEKRAYSKPGKPSGQKETPKVSVSRISTAARQKSDKRSEKQSTQKSVSPVKTSVQGNIAWQWPAKGRVVTNFGGSKRVNQGIDIKGKKGDSVTAAAAGKVVFVGSGLRGYGKLIIIKHNAVFLSAYAHNHRLHVKEGDKVKVGQLIADLGSTGSDFDRLHFEIRLDGKPVNPLRYLPKK